MSNGDVRLIEDYLPIQAISAEASREKSVRKGHISTLHLWWARRPLVACRAAVYGALVPADRWVQEVELKKPPGDAAKAERIKNGKKKGLNRKAAGEFITRLCKYPGEPKVIAEAQKHILEAHADRLSAELTEGHKSSTIPAWVEEFKFTGDRVTYDDIVADRAPRPRVLDMFAGGGAIPLEAQRLGCEAYALDLNPVAHIIELCTLVYPQKYGRPNLNIHGMTGPKNPKGKTTWGGLAEEVRYWGGWVLEKVRSEIGNLYPFIPDPESSYDDLSPGKQQTAFEVDLQQRLKTRRGLLTPIAYLWTRTVRCKNPSCGATVPLVKQTWLCKKAGRFAALRVIAPPKQKQVRFEVVEASRESEFDFDPSDFSVAGNASCPFCGTVANAEYVKEEGCAKRLGTQLMAIACVRPGKSGKVYLSAESCGTFVPSEESTAELLDAVCRKYSLTVPTEPIVDDAKNSFWCRLYGNTQYGDLYTNRQLVALLSFAGAIQEVTSLCQHEQIPPDHATALLTVLGTCVSKLADYMSTGCAFNYTGGRGVKNTFGRQALPLVWDFAESNPFNPDGASWPAIIGDIPAGIDLLTGIRPGKVSRGTATSLPYPPETLDAVVTDPPYYDNVSYADLSDFFYVWLKRSIGLLYPEHLSGDGAPKKNEAVADAVRHGGDKKRANRAYEAMMALSFTEAAKALKPSGQMIVVYAHKTTLGWATLVESLRQAGMIVTEAWPLDTEKPGRQNAQDTAALASSIFLIARKRATSTGAGNYEDDVQPELEQIVRERVETFWELGITGADLVIASVGAGLRAFTRYERVEYANGEEMPAEKFLAEVEAVVLDGLMSKVFGATTGSSSVAGVDAMSRFYVLWRYVYKAAEIESGEAIVFTYGQHVELDGPDGLSTGSDALLEKKKGKYRLRDFSERGDDADLGLPNDDGNPTPLIDVLHRALWLMENYPRKLAEFIDEARPNREQLRVVAAALAGPGLSGKSEEDVQRLLATTPAEQSTLGKLLANWKSLVPESLFDAGRK